MKKIVVAALTVCFITVAVPALATHQTRPQWNNAKSLERIAILSRQNARSLRGKLSNHYGRLQNKLTQRGSVRSAAVAEMRSYINGAYNAFMKSINEFRSAINAWRSYIGAENASHPPRGGRKWSSVANAENSIRGDSNLINQLTAEANQMRARWAQYGF